MEKVIKEIARSVLRKLPPAKVEFDDLLQEGRLAVWLQRDKIATLDAKHTRAFVAQCARWAMIDWVRYMWPSRGKNGAILNTNVDDYEESFSERGSVDTTLSHAQAMQAVERIENKLTANYRLEVLYLFIQGLESKDIAKRLCIRPETVSRYKKEIRKVVNEFIG